MGVSKSVEMSNTILKINGLFLMIMGTFGATMDLIGYFAGKGPFGKICFNNNLTIGQFEAHCLAIILGIIIFLGRRSINPIFFHKAAIGIHFVLFVANLIWFSIFTQTNSLVLGYITTITHFIFISLNSFIVIRHRKNNLKII